MSHGADTTLSDFLESESFQSLTKETIASVPPGPNARIAAIAEQLRNGAAVESITIRTLLSWFGAQRRGSFIVYWIRQVLQENGITTEPDFQSEWIDSNIQFALTSELTLPQSPEGPGSSEAVVLVGGAIADPAHKVGQLDAANRGVTL